MQGVRIRRKDTGAVGRRDVQAIGKVISEKPAMANVLESTLGICWCPMKGVVCKDLGDNIFLFTFGQESGKRKAVEEGPWWYGKELIIMEDFDPMKLTEEYEFNKIDERGRKDWCPFAYEYLLDFCYTCGVIGHVDRECNTKLKKDEKAHRGGSDRSSWRKEEVKANGKSNKGADEEEVQSPLKLSISERGETTKGGKEVRKEALKRLEFDVVTDEGGGDGGSDVATIAYEVEGGKKDNNGQETNQEARDEEMIVTEEGTGVVTAELQEDGVAGETKSKGG
ncbi:hypothetical protein D1007_39480 [Hordeum vulgare]|nr:hypothetical protein D1007_39480 [Hordeum vulgare]